MLKQDLIARPRLPIVAFLESSDEIPALPEQVPVHSDFDEICRFINQILG